MIRFAIALATLFCCAMPAQAQALAQDEDRAAQTTADLAMLSACLERQHDTSPCESVIYDACEAVQLEADDGSFQTTSGMAYCMWRQGNAWEALRLREYDKLHASLTAFYKAHPSGFLQDPVPLMERAKAAFESYRELECDFRRSLTTGTIRFLNGPGCYNNVTAPQAMSYLWETRGMEWQPTP